MDENKRMEMVAAASVHLKLFRDLMNLALPDDWIVSVVGFEQNESDEVFLGRFFADGADIDVAAALQTVIAMVQKKEESKNAIH